MPEFYADTASFVGLLYRSFSNEAVSGAADDIYLMARELDGHARNMSNYAMFMFRGFYYEELADLLSLSYSPHPWRSDVIAAAGPTRRPHFARGALEGMGDLRRDLLRQIDSEFSAPALHGDFPLIASFVAGHASERSELLSVALDVRDSATARAFRSWTSSIEHAFTSQARLVEIRNAQRDLESLAHELRRELGLRQDKVPSTQLKVQLGIPAASIEVPFQLQHRIPKWLTRVLTRRPHLKFLRTVARSSVEMAPFALQFQKLRP